MNNEQKFWITVWAIIGITVIAVSLTISGSVCLNNKNAFNAGYEQQQREGTVQLMWVKSPIQNQCNH